MNDLATNTNTALTDQHHALTAALEAIGWEMNHADLDMVSGMIRIEAKRFDGRVVRAFVTGTSSYIEAEVVSVRHFKDRGLPTARAEPILLSRQHCLGARHAVWKWCNYLADNPMPNLPALTRVDVQRLVAALFIEAPNPSPVNL